MTRHNGNVPAIDQERCASGSSESWGDDIAKISQSQSCLNCKETVVHSENCCC